MTTTTERLAPEQILEWERTVYDQSIHTPITEIANELKEVFSQKLTAAIVGIDGHKAVGEWARGERKPHPDTEDRLRLAFRIVKLLERVESPQAIRAWFMGSHPDLNDQSPALTLADDQVRVLRAARQFLAGG